MASITPYFDFQVAIEMCELCQEEEANYFCTTCHDNMCEVCKTAHKRSKASSNHNVVSSSLSKNNTKPRKPIKCITHPRENIQMYCKTCGEATCHKCISGNKHQTHIFEELETTLNKYRGDLSNHISEIKQLISEILKSLYNIDANVQEYIILSDQTIDGINKQRTHIKANIDNIADNMIDQVQKRRKHDLQPFEKEGENIQKILSEQSQYLVSCEEKLKSIDNISDIQRQIKQSTKLSLPSITHINPPTFVGDDIRNLQHIFGKLVDNLGENKSIPKSTDETVQTKKQESNYGAVRASVTANSTEVVSKIARSKNRSYVSAVNDKEAWCYDDENLVLIDIHGHVKREIKLDKALCSIAVTSAEELVVTESHRHIIKKYVSDEKCVNIVNTEPYETKGLCVTSQGDILVCLVNSKDDIKVVRVTTTGQIKQIIHEKGWSLFKRKKVSYPRIVAENINEDVVVADSYDPSTIVVTNKEGELKFKYPHSARSSYTIAICEGIACDNTGCILISDLGNHRIHQIDIDGRFIQFILTEQHGIQYPMGLSIDKKGQLWLCNHVGSEVVVYKYRS